MKNILFILLFSPLIANAQLVRTTPSGVNATTDSTYVNVTGDTMSGPLTLAGSSLTVTGNAFSVGGSTLVVTGGKVGVNTGGVSLLDSLHIIPSANYKGVYINGVVAPVIAFGSETTGLGTASTWKVGISGNSGTAFSIGTGASETGDKFFIKSNGNVGIGDTAPQAKLVVNGNIHSSGTISTSGFSKFGELSTGIKTITFSTTSATFEGSFTSVTHGVTASKIISLSSTLWDASGVSGVIPSSTVAGFKYRISFDATKIYVELDATESESILNKQVKVLMFYEE